MVYTMSVQGVVETIPMGIAGMPRHLDTPYRKRWRRFRHYSANILFLFGEKTLLKKDEDKMDTPAD